MCSRVCGVCRTVNTQPAGQQDVLGLTGSGSWAAPAQGGLQTLSALQITLQTWAVTSITRLHMEYVSADSPSPICRALQSLFSHPE